MEGNEDKELNDFIIIHAKWLREHYSYDEAEKFIKDTLEFYPINVERLLLLLNDCNNTYEND